MAIVRTVRILKGIGKRKPVFEVSFETCPGDRVKRKTQPSSLGFYHFYPEDMSDDEAKEILKQHLLKCCEADLKVIQEAKMALEVL